MFIHFLLLSVSFGPVDWRANYGFLVNMFIYNLEAISDIVIDATMAGAQCMTILHTRVDTYLRINNELIFFYKNTHLFP